MHGASGPELTMLRELLLLTLLSVVLEQVQARPFGGRRKAPRQCALEQRNTLVSLFDNANGANWAVTWDISANSDPCLDEWYGVQCDRQGNVRSLELVNNNLVGKVAPLIGRLTQLRTLNLSLNQLTGVLPQSFTQLTNLRFIQLTGNHFIGDFPSAVANFPHLSTLEISKNDFNAPLPDAITALPGARGVKLAMESYKCKTDIEQCRDYAGEVM